MLACFDIGASAIKGAPFHAPSDRPVATRLATPLEDLDLFAATLGQGIADMERSQATEAAAVAISIAGVVDARTGIMTCANIPAIHGRNLSGELSARLGRPVFIANDADCFALAEASQGAGRGHDVVFGVILGSGVGGGLVINRRIVSGPGGYGGEWGHGPVFGCVPALRGRLEAAGLPVFDCGCGQIGCVDTVGGARGLERLHRFVGGAALASHEITAGWLAGEAKASEAIDLYLDLVSGPLAMMVNTVGASVLPVGGGLSACRPLVAALDERLRARILWRSDAPLLAPAELSPEPGLIGAAMLGLTHLSEMRDV